MDFVNQNIMLIGIAVVSGLGLLWQLFSGRSGAAEINPVQATLLINRQDAVVVDVREADEYAAGHLPDARNIPLSKFSERIAEMERFKEKPLILYCATGVQAGKAITGLKKAGFAQLHTLAGGIDAWRQAGLPVKKGGRNK